ncbi:MAG: hypothetical protein JST83_01165 [Bacteroidetes bacterium]|nr:hypothetical protein [Bacteroidota bacterium]
MSYEKSKELILEQLKNYDESHKQYAWYKSPPSLLEVESAKLVELKGITTFSPLQEFKNLKAVAFGTTNATMTIDTLAGIEENEGIESLTFISKTKIKAGVDSISRMATLKTIGLYNVTSPVSADLLQPLRNLLSVSLSKEIYQLITVLPEGLERISLNFDAIERLPQWPVVPSVQEISIGMMTCKFMSLDSLACFPGLKEVKLSAPKILSDLSYAAQLRSLKSLEVNFADVSDLSPLRDHGSLEELRVRGTKLEKPDDLYPNNKLRVLYAEKTKLKSIAGISQGLPNLELLWIWDTKVKELEPLRAMTSLRGLDVTMLQAKDWSWLPTLQNMEVLDLCKTSFSDIGLLMQLPKLKYLRLAGSAADTSSQAYKDLEVLLENRGGLITTNGLNFDTIIHPERYV